MPGKSLVHYLNAWSLSRPQMIAATPTSLVYKVEHEGATAVLKLLTPVGIHDEYGGAIALKHFAGKGAIRLLRHDEGAHLLEYVSGDDLIPMVQDGDDEQATAIIGEVLNELHSEPPTEEARTLYGLGRRFRALFRKAEADRQASEDSLYVRGAAVAEELLAEPCEVRVLHGDMHHENVRRSERGWLALDPKGILGERIYDAANTLLNPFKLRARVQDRARLLRHASILAQTMGVEQTRLLAFTFAHACLSASWSLEDGDDPSHALHMAALTETLL